jgi:hypothetical protein
MKMPRFTAADAARAYDEWGANCGPGAIAAVLGMTLDELRPHLGDFERKGYTNPTLMWAVLDWLGIRWRRAPLDTAHRFPIFGLARVQWEGSWTAPGAPMRARYRHTHWIGAARIEVTPEVTEICIFDINAIDIGGWITFDEWSTRLVPWLLRQCEPKANGRWHLTHSVEIELANEARP